MNIIDRIKAAHFDYLMRHSYAPARLVINYDNYCALRSELGAMGYFSYPATIETFMGMKVNTTRVPVDRGFVVR